MERPAGPRKYFEDPPIARALFGNPDYAWIWLFVRLYLGAKWIEAGGHKLGDAKWMDTGVALKGFWGKAALTPPDVPRSAIRYSVSWCRAWEAGEGWGLTFELEPRSCSGEFRRAKRVFHHPVRG